MPDLLTAVIRTLWWPFIAGFGIGLACAAIGWLGSRRQR
jgi:hypothetical protein